MVNLFLYLVIINSKLIKADYSTSNFQLTRQSCYICFYLQAQTLFDDPAENFLVAIEQNDPAGIDSLLRQQEVNVDQVLKV